MLNKLDEEKIMELATPILCSLINNGYLPPIVAKGVDNAGGMIYDWLHIVGKQIRDVHRQLQLESDDK